MTDDHKTWTAETFLYDKFLTKQTKTSGRRGSSPIDVYNSYLQRGVDIDTLCNLGADIMNSVQTSGLEGIEPKFLKRCIWWCFRGKNLFGIHIVSPKPRLMFDPLFRRYFEEVHPKHKFTLYDTNVGGIAFEQGMAVKDIEDAFIEMLREVASEQGVDMDL